MNESTKRHWGVSLAMGLAMVILFSGNTKSNDIPSALDWRDNGGNFVTPPGDEGDCASCWAFAAAGMTESWYAIKNDIDNPTIDLSEQTLISCSSDGSCTHGGDMGEALDFIRDTGLPTEDCFPYEGEQDSCNRCDDWKSIVTKIPGWSWVDEDKAEDDDIKRALMNGPVTAWFHEHSEFEEYSSGVYKCEGDYIGDHFVLLIGWDDSDNAWIAKNNWGTDWGDGGYFKIAYGTCGIGQWVAQVGDRNDADDDDQGCGCGG